jgi:hypothetical protein
MTDFGKGQAIRYKSFGKTQMLKVRDRPSENGVKKTKFWPS